MRLPESAAWLLVLCLLCAYSAFAIAQEAETNVEINVQSLTPDEPVTNSGFGLTFPHYRPGSNDGYPVRSKYPFIDIAYKRFLWSELEPAEGQYRFEELEKWIAFWKQRGRRVSFGVMSMTDGRQATPLWVFQSGVPGVLHSNGRQIDPVMWNDIYLDKLEKFSRAMGERLRGGGDLEFLDIRGIGMWGEMHFGLNIEGMWTQDELYNHGLSEGALKKAYIRQMTFYRNAFPRTRLFLNVSPDRDAIMKTAPHLKTYFLPSENGDYKRAARREGAAAPFILPVSQDILKRAVTLGIGLRCDGLLAEENNSSKIISGYYQKYCYPGGPVQCIYEFAGEEKNPSDISRMLEYAIRDHAAYININFRELEKLDVQTALLLKQTAMKIGYHLYLSSLLLTYSPQYSAHKPSCINISQTWINKGNIALQGDYSLQLRLLDAEARANPGSKIVATQPVSGWLPARSVRLETKLKMPQMLKQGRYILGVSMKNASNNTVNLYLKKAPGEEFYPLAELIVTADSKGKGIVRIGNLSGEFSPSLQTQENQKMDDKQ